jgi:hypothetical protein
MFEISDAIGLVPREVEHGDEIRARASSATGREAPLFGSLGQPNDHPNMG